MAKVIRIPGPGRDVLKKAVEGLNGRTNKVGWFQSAKYEDGTPVAYVATIQEFGSPAQAIPPRPFMRPTIEQRRAAWKALAARGARAVFAGDIDGMTMMGQLGEAAKGDIQKAIRDITAPPLSPVTIQLRKWKREGLPIGKTQVGWAAALVAKGLNDTTTPSGAKPLVDTGTLLQTITTVTE